MNKLTQNNAVHSQTIEIPKPLEIHPSVDPELARGLIATIDHIAVHWDTLDISLSNFWGGSVGCFACHAERFSNWRRPDNITQWRVGGSIHDYPIGDARRFYAPHVFNERCWWKTFESATARIEHFLRTGE